MSDACGPLQENRDAPKNSGYFNMFVRETTQATKMRNEWPPQWASHWPQTH